MPSKKIDNFVFILFKKQKKKNKNIATGDRMDVKTLSAEKFIINPKWYYIFQKLSK